ncbi:hypothetical protein D3C81_561830 [compost metagenome]
MGLILDIFGENKSMDNINNSDEKVFEVRLKRYCEDIDTLIGESLKMLKNMGREVKFLGFDKYNSLISLIDGEKYRCVRGTQKSGCVRFFKTNCEILDLKNRDRVLNIRKLIN